MKKQLCAAVGGVSLPALMMASADAQVVHTGDTLVLDATVDGAFVDYDFDGDGNDDLRVSFSGAQFNANAADSVQFQGALGVADDLMDTGGESLAEIFRVGELLQTTDFFQATLFRAIADLPEFSGTSIVAADQLAFFGLAFEASGQVLLGQFSLAYDPSAQEVLISNFAYEQTPGVDLEFAVPEPASLSALAIGAAGVLAGTRRRK
ncbi:MAG: PEP-CTERM sorting domain-containing protein [Actinomycetota bacterium]